MVAVTTLLLLVLAVPIAYYAYGFLVFYISMKRRAKHILKFPGLDPHPLWGHLHLFPGPNDAGLRWFRDYANQHAPGLSKAFFGPFHATVIMWHPKTVQQLLRTSGPNDKGLQWMREQCALSSGRVGKIFFGPIPTISIVHPATVKTIMHTSGPNEAGLQWMRDCATMVPRLGKIFYGPFVASLSLIHSDTVKTLLKTSGPGEAGLERMRETPARGAGRLGKVFFGPFLPTVSVIHPDLVKVILKTSGPGEAGLEEMRETSTRGTGRIGKVFYGPFLPTVSVVHPDLVKVILKTSEPKPLLVGGYKFALPWLGDGLLISGGKKWGRNRRLLTPAFHFDILKPYMEVNNQSTDIFLNKIEKFATKGESFEVFQLISLLTLDIILRCAFSYESNCQVEGDTHPYVQAVSYLADTMVYRLLRPWLYPDFIFFLSPAGRKFKEHCDFVHSVSNNIIQTRKQTLASTGGAKPRKAKYLDFVDILLTCKDADGMGLTDAEIQAEADTFLFEGHDTTASGISWALYDMATNPDWQEKCQQEIDGILKDRDSDDILWDDLPKLKTLTMCIKESLRLHTPVPFIERQTTKDMYIDGYFLPSGTVVDIQLYVLHHNSHVWPEPMAFKPERFDPDNPEKMDNYAFVPFSAGPRNCIGQNFAMHEMKSAIAKILRRFKLELDPHHKVEHRIMVVMKTENGMYMKAKPRKVQ